MGTANKVYHRKRKGIKWGRFVIFVLFIAYIIIFVYTFFAQSIDVTNITYGELEESETVYGYITRNEQIVAFDIHGELYPIINEGERVSKGQSVAVIKNNSSGEISKKIKELTSKLNTFSTPGIFNNDIILLDNEVNSILNSLMLTNYNEAFCNLGNTKNKIETKLKKKSVIVGEQSPKGSAEREYFEELKKYEAQLNITQQELTAPIAGTVVYKLDGYENAFSSKVIADYDASTFSKLEVPTGELVGTVKPNSFKIIDNIEGYITVVSNSKRALNIGVDNKVKLRFPEINQDVIPGKVEFVSIEDGQATITFRINRGIEALVNYRKIKVDIIWNNETGMKIPSTAIQKDENGNNKIFIVNGNRIIKKNVNIISEWNGEAIIENKNVFLYDSIVLDAKNVNEDKMVIKK